MSGNKTHQNGINNNSSNRNGTNIIDQEEISSPLMSSSINNNSNNNSERVRFNDSLEIISDNSYEAINRRDEAERTKSATNLLKYTLKHEGIGGLYQGLGPKLLHAALMYAFIFSFKEKATYYTFFALILITQRRNPKNIAKQALVKVGQK